jgi:flagellar basal-body rod modification protein FlgD
MSSYLNPINAITNTGSETPVSQTKPASSVSVDQQQFLQLFVAQLKNQDPLNPADGTEFLSQLAQFSELEQMIAIRQDVGVIRTSSESATPADPTTPVKGE